MTDNNDTLNNVNALTQFDSTILMKVGNVELTGFEDTIKKANLIRDKLKTVVVTEDTLQANKKMLAKLNKAFREIDDQRKEYKKKYLEPFSVIEEQCKELKAIVQESESYVREQIREFEEHERDLKLDEIKKLWEKRTARLEYKSIIRFEDFIEDSYLNKSFSMKKVEQEIVSFIQKFEEDIEALKTLCETNEYPLEEALVIYRNEKNVSLTILDLDKRRKDLEEAKKELETVEPDTPDIPGIINDVAEVIDDVDDDEFIQVYVRSVDYDDLLRIASSYDIPIYTMEN